MRSLNWLLKVKCKKTLENLLKGFCPKHRRNYELLCLDDFTRICPDCVIKDKYIYKKYVTLEEACQREFQILEQTARSCMDLKDKVYGLESKAPMPPSHRSNPVVMPESLEDGLSLKFLESLASKVRNKFDQINSDIKLSFQRMHQSLSKIEAKLQKFVMSKQDQFAEYLH